MVLPAWRANYRTSNAPGEGGATMMEDGVDGGGQEEPPDQAAEEEGEEIGKRVGEELQAAAPGGGDVFLEVLAECGRGGDGRGLGFVGGANEDQDGGEVDEAAEALAFADE